VAGKLVCFGDLCVDVVGRSSGDETGADVTLADLSIRPAGAALNCAVAAAAEGVDVEMLGLVGDDDFGELVLRYLDSSRVGRRHVRRTKGRTGTVISIVDSAGQTKLYSYRGVNAQAYGPLPDCGGFVYVSGYSFQDTGSRLTAETLLSTGARCALDPSFQYARDFKRRRLEVEFLLPNLEEARLMTGRAASAGPSSAVSPGDCCEALRASGVKTVVVKLGPEGCCVNGEFVNSEAVSAVDTTGAGDAFAGTFLAAILKGNGVVEAARRANRIAADLVSRKR